MRKGKGVGGSQLLSSFSVIYPSLNKMSEPIFSLFYSLNGLYFPSHLNYTNLLSSEIPHNLQ